MEFLFPATEKTAATFFRYFRKQYKISLLRWQDIGGRRHRVAEPNPANESTLENTRGILLIVLLAMDLIQNVIHILLALFGTAMVRMN